MESWKRGGVGVEGLYGTRTGAVVQGEHAVHAVRRLHAKHCTHAHSGNNKSAVADNGSLWHSSRTWAEHNQVKSVRAANLLIQSSTAASAPVILAKSAQFRSYLTC